MNLLGTLLFSAIILAWTSLAASAETRVVASIKPLHSLVAAIMEGVGEPGLIVDGAGSPHAYSLKPSQAAEIEDAELIFWIGPELEAFLQKPIAIIGAKAAVVELTNARDLIRLQTREGGAFETHGRDTEDDHAVGRLDTHIWLDPQNAKVFVREIAESLVKSDPSNAGRYESNADRVAAKLDALTADVQVTLEPVKGRTFIALHDAYQHFEHRFGIAAAGSITVSPEIMPGAQRIGEIRAKLKDLGATCVFAEPQFESKLIRIVVEGTGARSGVLDPLGAGLENGPELYFDLIRNMAHSIRDCLGDTG